MFNQLAKCGELLGSWELMTSPLKQNRTIRIIDWSYKCQQTQTLIEQLKIQIEEGKNALKINT
jgi:hypothetical protein